MAFLCKYFIYNGQNTKDNNLLICSFEDSPMREGETQLTMSPLYSETISSAYRVDYGARYSSVLSPSCIIIHADGSMFSFDQKRSFLRWLTGKKELSWLQIKRIDDEDFVPGEEEDYTDDPNLVNVLCRVTDVSEYKIGNETAGFKVTWTANSPFAYSEVKTISYDFTPEHTSSLSDHVTLDIDSDEEYDSIYPVIVFNNYSSVPCNLWVRDPSANPRMVVDNIPAEATVYIDNLNQIGMYGTIEDPMQFPLGDKFNKMWFRLITGSNVSIYFTLLPSDELGEEDVIGGFIQIKYRLPIKVGEL